MKKLFVNRRPVEGPWGGGNHFVRAVYENAERHGFEITDHFNLDLDAILVVDPRYDEMRISINEIASIKSSKPQIRVIHRVNECDKRKGDNEKIDPLLRVTSKFSDVSIFISKWLEEHHRSTGWFCDRSAVVHNGTHKKNFLNTRDDCDKIRIVTHHWSNNYMKGFDVYDAIDEWVASQDDFEFTYIGRERGTFKNTRIVKPTFGKDLGAKLSNHDVYISGSRWDPGPNHIVEALACDLPVYVHVDGGGAVEMAGQSHVYQNIDQLISILESKSYDKNDGMDVRDWDDCIDDYFEIMRSVM